MSTALEQPGVTHGRMLGVVPGTQGWYAAKSVGDPISDLEWHYGYLELLDEEGLNYPAFYPDCMRVGYRSWHGPFTSPQPADFPGAAVCSSCAAAAS